MNRLSLGHGIGFIEVLPLGHDLRDFFFSILMKWWITDKIFVK